MNRKQLEEESYEFIKKLVELWGLYRIGEDQGIYNNNN